MLFPPVFGPAVMLGAPVNDKKGSCVVTHGRLALHSWCEQRCEESRTDGRREKEREREAEWADGEVLGRKELFSKGRCEDITVQGEKNHF